MALLILVTFLFLFIISLQLVQENENLGQLLAICMGSLIIFLLNLLPPLGYKKVPVFVLVKKYF